MGVRHCLSHVNTCLSKPRGVCGSVYSPHSALSGGFLIPYQIYSNLFSLPSSAKCEWKEAVFFAKLLSEQSRWSKVSRVARMCVAAMCSLQLPELGST